MVESLPLDSPKVEEVERHPRLVREVGEWQNCDRTMVGGLPWTDLAKEGVGFRLSAWLDWRGP